MDCRLWTLNSSYVGYLGIPGGYALYEVIFEVEFDFCNDFQGIGGCW
jgi:hypothetical protein